jgi:hypothetical protein
MSGVQHFILARLLRMPGSPLLPLRLPLRLLRSQLRLSPLRLLRLAPAGKPLCVFSAGSIEMVKQSRKQQKKQEGGKRKGTRKLGKKASAWHSHVMKVYKEMKAKDASVRLMDAMKAAKKRKGEMKKE